MIGTDGKAQDPGAALALVREAKRAAAERVRAPAWFHKAVGLTVGLLFATTGWRLGGLGPLVTIGICLAAAWLASQYTKAAGVRMNGFTAGGPRARRIMWGGMSLLASVAGAGLYARFVAGIEWAMVPAGILLALLTVRLSLAWERRFVEEAGA